MFLRFFHVMSWFSLWLIAVFLFVFEPIGALAQQDKTHLSMLNLRFDAAQKHTSLVATFNANPEQKLMRLANPARLVIDLPATRFMMPVEMIELHGLAGNIRYGLDGAGGARIVVGMRSPFQIGEVEVEALHDEIWQMRVELYQVDNQTFVSELAATHVYKIDESDAKDPPLTQHQGYNTDEGLKKGYEGKSKSFTVVIDAGHGGFDSGAEGVSGVLEKDVTLAFAHTLRETLQRKALQEGVDVAIHLTREGDEFLRLSQRVQQARLHHADLFVSIHADSIHIPGLRGATVYTLSDEASDALARAIAENENKAEFLGDVPPDEAPEVQDILLDLTRRETDAFSRRFADTLIVSLHQGNVRLIKDPHRYAGFMVLRAPDIPSILLELGYLSNGEDEKLVVDPLWRQNMTQLIADSVLEFARIHHNTQH